MKVTTVEGVLKSLEHFGFKKSRKKDAVLYQLEGEPGNGQIKLSGPIDRQYLVACDVMFNKNFIYGYHIREPFAELCSVSESQLCYEQANEESILILKGISTYINPGVPGVIHIPAGTRLAYTSFVVRGSIVASRMSSEGSDTDLVHPSNAAIINQLPPCHRQARILSDIVHCKMQDAVRNLYYEVKALEVLCLLSEALTSEKQCKPQPSVQDRAAIERARKILASNISSPPSISALARQVGINATKLKQTFKQETGHTIFGYLRNIRLGAAVSLMSDPGATITSISQDVGYKSPSKFTAAFKHQYGLNPGQYLRMVRQVPN